MNKEKKMFLIRLPYWLGIAADALWAVALVFPGIFAALTNNPEFNPNLQTKQILWVAGSLMAGWTVLLVWAVINPVERRGVALITAFPVVSGLFIVALIGYLNGNSNNIWILAKTVMLFVLLNISYILAGRTE